MSESLTFVPGGPTRICVDVVLLNDDIGTDNVFFTCILTGQQPTVTVRVTIIDNGKAFWSYILDCCSLLSPLSVY